MTSWERLIGFITGVALLALSGGSLAFTFGWSGTSLITYLQELSRTPFDAAVLTVVFFFWGVYFLLSAVRFPGRQARALVQENELGTVRINIKAIETLVYRTAHSIRGIKDVDARVSFDESGLGVNLSVVVAPDVSVPAVCSEVQEQVKSYLRETVGIDTNAVAIEVRAIDSGSKTRVE